MIPYARQKIFYKDIKRVKRVLKSEYLTQGPIVSKFENALSSYCGASFGVATNSATSALHIACLALGVTPGDRVWTSPISFVASANCALFCGASVDFVDIDPKTYNMSIDALTKKLKNAEILNQLPKVIIPVHFAGQSCEMEKIHTLSKKYGFKIIEDASHAIGGEYKNNRIGSSQFSDITVFSFHPVKIITTGEGGMALTNNPELASTMRLLISHGIEKDKIHMENNGKHEIWNYKQTMLGYNYRITDFQAALGISQLGNIKKFIKKRRIIADFYDKNINPDCFDIPWQHPDTLSSYHLYPIRIKDTSGLSQIKVYNKLWDNGIAVNIHYIPIHKQPFYQQIGFRHGDYPESEKYFTQTISLPIFYGLSRKKMKVILRILNEQLI